MTESGEQLHKIDEFTMVCICKDRWCKRWKESVNTPDKERRCNQCWGRMSIQEDDNGNRTWWCFLCGTSNFSST